jgi:hypothetical protein
VSQPALELPFAPGERWAVTGGPHTTWSAGTPRGALDLSPVINLPPCAPSPAWVTASAGGIVTRSARNLTAVDLDGDGFEGTGWVILYLHLADDGRVQVGTKVKSGDPLGHPSCEGGRATGTHVHMARKYNGEWLPAGPPLPLVLSGWEAIPGEKEYEGKLVKGGQTVTASPVGPRTSVITR